MKYDIADGDFECSNCGAVIKEGETFVEGKFVDGIEKRCYPSCQDMPLNNPYIPKAQYNSH